MGYILSRRDFLKTTALGFGVLVIQNIPYLTPLNINLPNFPKTGFLGRILENQVRVKSRPDDRSSDVNVLNKDDIVVWENEVTGVHQMWQDQRYVETEIGYIYAPNLQRVSNQPNSPVTNLPNPEGIWAEVTIPYVDLILANPPARSPWLKYTSSPRLYYSQIIWIDQVKVDENSIIWYHINEKFGSYGDAFWAIGEAFRPITIDEISPLHLGAQDKLVVVDLTYQTLSCFEGKNEVYFCRISTGGKVEMKENKQLKWATPPGTHTIWRKMISVHMSGGTTGGGYDLAGIGWTTLFSGIGLAIHSTFWHNNFGVPKSHGCVNAHPEDAKWIFRWTLPETNLYPGDIMISGLDKSTRVKVVES
jgi:hypothetical protein